MATLAKTASPKSSSSARTTKKTPKARPKTKATPPLPTRRPNRTAKPDTTSLSGEAKSESAQTDRVSSILAGLTGEAKTGEGAQAKPKDSTNRAALESLDKVTGQDHKDWGGQTTTPNGVPIKHGNKENEKSHYKTVGKYWEPTALKGKDGKDSDPWSAAYISSAHKRAGVTNFPPSIRHSTYINNAIEARKNGDTDAPYVGHRTSERAPQKGDMVCFTRAGSKASYDDQQGGKYPSHCDFVKKVGDGYIETLGGNVGNSVSTRRFTTDDKGMINDKNQNFIAILAPQNLEMK